MALWLVRHAQTEWSEAGKHTGRSDPPLTDKGRQTAAAIELPHSDWARVICSPRRRALETAALCGFDEPELSDDLLEWDYGEYEGITTKQIRASRPDWNLWTMGAPGGEGPADLGTRADRVIAAALAADGDTLAFAHGHILRVIGARWVDQPAEHGGRLGLSTGAVCVLGFERETRVIERWNVT